MPSPSMSSGYAPVTSVEVGDRVGDAREAERAADRAVVRNRAAGRRAARDVQVGPAVVVAVEDGDAAADVEREVAAVEAWSMPAAAVSSTKCGAPGPDAARPQGDREPARDQRGERRPRHPTTGPLGRFTRLRLAVLGPMTPDGVGSGAAMVRGASPARRTGPRSPAGSRPSPPARPAAARRRGRPRRTVHLDAVRIGRWRTSRISMAGATGGSPPAVDEDPRRPVGRDVERDLDLDPAGRAVDVDPLIGLDPRRAGERGDAAREAQERRSSGRRRRGRVAHDRRRDRRGSLAEEHPRQVDRVAADVVQRAAAELARCSGCSSGRRCGSENQPATAAARRSGPTRRAPDGDPRRVLAVHERLHQRRRRRRRRRRPCACASATVSASGFSHRTCLPARAARDRPLRRGGGWAAGCRRRRRRGRPGAPRTSRSARDPELPRRWPRPARGHARRWRGPRPRGERCMPGMTFSTAMLAVDRIPQRSGRRRSRGSSSRPRPSSRARMRGLDTSPQL